MKFLEILKVVLLGIVEGITEWLPVSSTGHMLLIDEIFSLKAGEFFKEMFFVVIQLGAILAVLVMFWHKLFPFQRVPAPSKSENTEASSAKPEARLEAHSEAQTPTSTNVAIKKVWKADKAIFTLWAKVIVACLPAAAIGVLFDDLLEKYLHRPVVIALTLIVYGVIFILLENKNKNRELPIRTTAEITYKDALIIGAFQVLSLIPGTSRSGATIIGALLIGVARPAGAEFTFFLAIPVMFGASALKLLKFFVKSGGFTGAELGYLLIGSAVAFAVSLFAIKFLMNFVKKHDFKIFGWYRIALGALVIATLVIPPLFA